MCKAVGIDAGAGRGKVATHSPAIPVFTMLPVLITLGILLGIALLVGLWAAGTYNGLVGLRNAFKNAFAQIDVQLQRRYDLIPNLVETAKGYMKHERETLEAVIAARNQAYGAAKAVAGDPANPEAMQTLLKSEGALGGALSRLLVTVEQYPNLKADTQMSSIMEELKSTENRVAFARQAYNDGVMVYNTTREKFPAVLIAGMLGFLPAQLFEVNNVAAKEAPKVSF